MFEQSRRLSQPLKWGRREKTAIAAVLSCLVLALVALGAFALTSGGHTRKGCIAFTFASTLGGAEEHACGVRARRICASPEAFQSLREELVAACRRAHLPVAPS